MSESCLNCRRFSKCSYENKNRHYKCKNYKNMSLVNDGVLSIDSLFEKVDIVPEGSTHKSTKKSNLIMPTGVPDSINYSKAQKQLEDMFAEVADNKSPFPTDLRIDDRDLPEFSNFYSFIYDRDYGISQMGIEPFGRQTWIATKLFMDYCPSCSKKKSNFMENIENVPVDFNSKEFPDYVQLLNNGVCPKCKRGRAEFIKKGKLKLYFEMDGCIGQRAGKSITFSFLESYRHHKYLKMQRPSEILTGLPNVTLMGTYTATDAKTATETLWKPLMDIIGESRWFMEYHALLMDYGLRYGEETFRSMDTFLSYRCRKIMLYAAAPNARNLRGRTRCSSGIDELGWFDASQEATNKIRISASAIYDALRRSHRTLKSSIIRLYKQGYNNVTQNISVNISSPSSYNDKIMSLVRENKDSKEVLAIHLPTWEFNPKEPRENFDEEFRSDPVTAARDYGAEPPMTAAPFISSVSMVMDCFTRPKNLAEIHPIFRAISGDSLAAHAAEISFNVSKIMPPAVLAIDAGLTNNSFAIAIGYRKDGIVVFDTLVEIAPHKGKTRLAYSKIFNSVLVPMLKPFNICAVFADRWNSAMLLDTVRDTHGVKAEQYSLKYNDFIVFKSYMEGHKILFPKISRNPDLILRELYADYPHEFLNKAADHLFYQCLTVSDNGKTILKGVNRTDDIFRAVVLASKYLLDADWCAKNLKDTQNIRQQERGLVAMSGFYGNGMPSINPTSNIGIAALVDNRARDTGNIFAREPK